MINLLTEQDGLYTLFLKGVKNSKEIQEFELITNIVKAVNPYQNYESFEELAFEKDLQFVISNTTEAGIFYDENDTLVMRPPHSFPAKLTQLLYKRFEHFKGDSTKGLSIIPCELINHNADSLKEIILKYCDDWNLELSFINWIQKDCSFHNTLVDRIVPGYPRDQIESYNNQLNYIDKLIVSAETFLLWVIEGDDSLKEKFPFHLTDLDVKIVNDMQPYRTRKVRILNGAHTAMVPLSLLYGNETVKQTIDNSFTGNFVNKAIFDEINETLSMNRKALDLFADEVLDRFRNPFIVHKLADIALNSISKFKVRVLPSIKEYYKIHEILPENLTFSLACLIRFYKGTWQNSTLPVNDSQDIIDVFNKIWQLDSYIKISQMALSSIEFWGEDLTLIKGLTENIAISLEAIDTVGLEQALLKD